MSLAAKRQGAGAKAAAIRGFRANRRRRGASLKPPQLPATLRLDPSQHCDT